MCDLLINTIIKGLITKLNMYYIKIFDKIINFTLDHEYI